MLQDYDTSFSRVYFFTTPAFSSPLSLVPPFRAFSPSLPDLLSISSLVRPVASYTRAFGDGPRNFEPWSSDVDDTLSWHPLSLTTTPHQREDVSALDRFNVHRCHLHGEVFSGTWIELMTCLPWLDTLTTLGYRSPFKFLEDTDVKSCENKFNFFLEDKCKNLEMHVCNTSTLSLEKTALLDNLHKLEESNLEKVGKLVKFEENFGMAVSSNDDPTSRKTTPVFAYNILDFLSLCSAHFRMADCEV
ncbi:hypothetical protein TNCV_1612951 [Trichonephila clavipes]|nr:hypothetical protein TNCV_1612951 [Trichonephila clavipes]